MIISSVNSFNAQLYIGQLSLELGGNAPFIVFDDADLDVALKALAMSKFRNAGQTCISSNRILVQDGIYDRFLEKVVNYVKNEMRCGDGFHPSSTVGPLINRKGLEKASCFSVIMSRCSRSVCAGSKSCRRLHIERRQSSYRRIAA